MAFILTDVQKVTLSVQPVDAAGNPAALDGAPVWTSTDPSVLDVVASADGLSAVATAVGPLGTAQISVLADADLGAGVITITGVLDVQVMASQAVSFSITPAAPEPK
jgi:hypothetical protein